MPNWCSNTLDVCGNREELKRFKEYARTVNGEKVNVLDTEQFVPYPQKFKDVDNREGDNREDRDRSFNLDLNEDKDLLVDGMNGYDWCINHWGSKWGICDAHIGHDNIEDEFNTFNRCDGQIVYFFESAWSQCSPVVQKMSEMFPKLEFNYSYEESGCDFMGEQTFSKGVITFEENRDYQHYCEDCEFRGDEVVYDDIKEKYLCEECRYTDLQKVVFEKLKDGEFDMFNKTVDKSVDNKNKKTESEPCT